VRQSMPACRWFADGFLLKPRPSRVFEAVEKAGFPGVAAAEKRPVCV
jgi:hypothetical protein